MKLTLIETEHAYLVVFDNNPDDWVVRFSKDNHFPAQEWAERMGKLYNLRIYPPRGGEALWCVALSGVPRTCNHYASSPKGRRSALVRGTFGSAAHLNISAAHLQSLRFVP